mgnify:CR=1 FL=1
MSYEIWTEKYRPKRLDDIKGQDEIVKHLKAFVEQKNMPHLLFTGPPGVGKTTAALALARELYGENWKLNFLELNASVSKNTPILVKINGKTIRTTFGELDKIYFKDNINSFGDGEYVVPDDLEVLTIDKNYNVVWAKVKYLIRHKVNKILRIKLEGGGILELTGNHSVMIIDEEGNIVMKNAIDLKPGDYLLSFVTKIKGNINEIDVDGELYHINSRTVLIEKLKLNEEIGWMLGLYVAEGAVGGGQVIYTLNYPKRVPWFIYDAPLDVKVSFLRGCADGDGSEKWGEVIRISSVSKDLLIDLAWLGRISGIETSIFDEEMRLVWKGSMKYRKSDLLPSKPFIKFFEEISDKININWRYIFRHQLYEGKDRISKEFILEVMENIDVNKLSEEEKERYYKLLKLAKSDLHVVRIKEIEVIDYNDYVYDVSVPGNEMFFAGEIPILLHNSDDRGIDVIREKVKEFAKTKPIGDVPFKIIFLDEADAMTRDAQQALRRIMEEYSATTRFILSCNYSSKIIEPIQSRTVIFRFKELSKESVFEILRNIANNEGLELNDEALEAIYYISEGDMRKAINILQAASLYSKKIEADLIYEVASVAKPKEIQDILNLALQGKFREARDKLIDTMLKYGLAGEDIIKYIAKEVYSLNLSEKDKLEILYYIGEVEYRLLEGSNPIIQLGALLAYLGLKGMQIKK